jgi:hypothetical protein
MFFDKFRKAFQRMGNLKVPERRKGYSIYSLSITGNVLAISLWLRKELEEVRQLIQFKSL